MIVPPRRNDGHRAALAGFPATTHHAGAAWGGGLHAGLRFSIAPPLYIDVGVRTLALGTRGSSALDGRVLGGGLVGVGLSL